MNEHGGNFIVTIVKWDKHNKNRHFPKDKNNAMRLIYKIAVNDIPVSHCDCDWRHFHWILFIFIIIITIVVFVIVRVSGASTGHTCSGQVSTLRVSIMGEGE